MAYDDASDLVMCGATSLAAIRYSQDEVVWLRSLQRIVTAKQTSAGLAVLAADGQDDRIGLHLLDKAGGSIFEIPIGEGSLISRFEKNWRLSAAEHVSCSLIWLKAKRYKITMPLSRSSGPDFPETVP